MRAQQEKKNVFICVDDYSRFTWVDFIKEKFDTFNVFIKLCIKLKNEKGRNIGKIVRIRSDHRTKFKNAIFANFCDKHGIAHEFFTLKIPQQNVVVEKKNITL